MTQYFESPDEVHDYLANEYSGSGKGKIFEVAEELLGGDIIFLEENEIVSHFKPNGLTEEDLDNLTDIEYIRRVRTYGPKRA